MADDFVPSIALDYLKQKKLKPAFSYKDVYDDELATSFIVTKAMQIDVLCDIKTSSEKALEKGQSFEQFKKELKPTLQQKGWWGKKEMTDPLTGHTVNAQLGSDRRLQLIYDANMRSAYQKGNYDRTMNSDLHPYMMYLIGTSKVHRPEHVAYDRLILPKDDPWWNIHAPDPLKNLGCQCTTMAISEARKQLFEKEGMRIANSPNPADDTIVKIKTQAPEEEFRAYYNERRDTLELLPRGVAPGFNWSHNTTRNSAVLQSVVTKAQEKMPEQFDEIIKSVLKSEVSKKAHYGFIENALERKKDGKYLSAVGVFDRAIASFLRKNSLAKNGQAIIMLQSKLVSSPKFSGKHTVMQNAPLAADWFNLMDYLMDAAVYFDGKGLIYLYKKSESTYVKIAVDLGAKSTHKGFTVNLPKIDTMYLLDISAEGDRGIREFQRIIEMKKIR